MAPERLSALNKSCQDFQQLKVTFGHWESY